MANWFDETNELPLNPETTDSPATVNNPYLTAFQRGLAGLNPDGSPTADASPALPETIPQYAGTPGVVQGLGQYLNQKPQPLSEEAQARAQEGLSRLRQQAPAQPAPESEAPMVFGLDTLAAAKDWVVGMGTTVPAAYHRLKEDDTRPDLYSPEAKEAFAKEAALGEDARAEQLRREQAGESTQLGSAIREAIPSSGFSVTSMAAALPAGLAMGAATQAAIPIPGSGIVGGIVGSFGGSGTAAFRMARSMSMDEWFKQAETASMAKNKRAMTEEEKQQLHTELQPLATDSGLWEAGPEAIGNAAMLLGGGIALKLLGKGAISQIAGGAMKKAGIRAGAAALGMGTELAGETTTEVFQAKADARSELVMKAQAEGRQVDPVELENALSRYEKEGGGGVTQAFKDILAPTIGTMVMFGLAGGAVKGGQKTYERLVTNPQEAQGIVDMANNQQVLSALPEASLQNLSAMGGHLRKQWFQEPERQANLDQALNNIEAELSSRETESADIKQVRQQTMGELWGQMQPTQQKGILAFLGGNQRPGLTGFVDEQGKAITDDQGKALGEIDVKGLQKLAPVLGWDAMRFEMAKQQLANRTNWYGQNADTSAASPDTIIDDQGNPWQIDPTTGQLQPMPATPGAAVPPGQNQAAPALPVPVPPAPLVDLNATGAPTVNPSTSPTPPFNPSKPPDIYADGSWFTEDDLLAYSRNPRDDGDNGWWTDKEINRDIYENFHKIPKNGSEESLNQLVSLIEALPPFFANRISNLHGNANGVRSGDPNNIVADYISYVNEMRDPSSYGERGRLVDDLLNFVDDYDSMAPGRYGPSRTNKNAALKYQGIIDIVNRADTERAKLKYLRNMDLKGVRERILKNRATSSSETGTPPITPTPPGLGEISPPTAPPITPTDLNSTEVVPRTPAPPPVILNNPLTGSSTQAASVNEGTIGTLDVMRKLAADMSAKQSTVPQAPTQPDNISAQDFPIPGMPLFTPNLPTSTVDSTEASPVAPPIEEAPSLSPVPLGNESTPVPIAPSESPSPLSQDALPVENQALPSSPNMEDGSVAPIDTAEHTSYPDRKLNLKTAKTDFSDEFNDVAWANVALANMNAGEVIRAGNRQGVVKKNTDKRITITWNNPDETTKDIVYHPGSKNWEGLVRDLGATLGKSARERQSPGQLRQLGGQPDTDVSGQAFDALLRDPAFRYDPQERSYRLSDSFVGQAEETPDNLPTPTPRASHNAEVQTETEAQITPLPDSTNAPVRDQFEAYAQQQDAIASDWASRDYKQNQTQVELSGDGSRNSETISVGAANEGRRRKAIESAGRNAQEIRKFSKKSDQEMLEEYEKVRTAVMGWPQGELDRLNLTREQAVETELNSRLFGMEGWRGEGTPGAALTRILEPTRLTNEQAKVAEQAELDRFMVLSEEEQNNEILAGFGLPPKSSAEAKVAPTETPSTPIVEDAGEGGVIVEPDPFDQTFEQRDASSRQQMLDDPDFRAAIDGYINTIGWSTKGGTPYTTDGSIPGRQPWLPKDNWFKDSAESRKGIPIGNLPAILRSFQEGRYPKPVAAQRLLDAVIYDYQQHHAPSEEQVLLEDQLTPQETVLLNQLEQELANHPEFGRDKLEEFLEIVSKKYPELTDAQFNRALIKTYEDKLNALRNTADNNQPGTTGQSKSTPEGTARPDFESTGRPTSEPPLLTDYTLEELDAENARVQAELEAKRQTDAAVAAKAQADKDVDSFTLSGSNHPADVAAAAGQKDLLASDANEKKPAQPPQSTQTISVKSVAELRKALANEGIAELPDGSRLQIRQEKALGARPIDNITEFVLYQTMPSGMQVSSRGTVLSPQSMEDALNEARKKLEGIKKPPAANYTPQEGWETNLMKSRAYAKALGIDTSGKSLGQLKADIGRTLAGEVSSEQSNLPTTAPEIRKYLRNSGATEISIRSPNKPGDYFSIYATPAGERFSIQGFGYNVQEAFANWQKTVEERKQNSNQEPKPGNAKSKTTSEVRSDLVEYFKAGNRFKNITEARAFITERSGTAIQPGTKEAKQADELLEQAIVKRAEFIASTVSAPVEAFKQLVALYEQQPNLNVRTSTSVEQQAYSTPVPLAYLASQLAGISLDNKAVVVEPTAGNGALLIETAPNQVLANELNPERAQWLKENGYDATQQDATAWKPGKKADIVIANPPFGTVRSNGQRVIWTVPSSVAPTGNYETGEIDHAIVLQQLANLKDDGVAVLLVGGVEAKNDAAKSDKYDKGAKRDFYWTLFNDYNVVGMFTISGDLYTKQGAGYPVDVIVIHGRGKSALSVPAAKVPRVYSAWNTLEEVLTNEGLSAQQWRQNDTKTSVPGGDGKSGTKRDRPVTGDAGTGTADTTRSTPESVGDRTDVSESGVPGERDRRGDERSGVSTTPGENQSEQPTTTAKTDSGTVPADAAGGVDSGTATVDLNALFKERLAARAAARNKSADTTAAPEPAVAEPAAAPPTPSATPVSTPTRTASEVAASAGTNAVMGLKEMGNTLHALFGTPPGQLNSGLPFNEDTYAKAKPAFEAALVHFKNAANDVVELMDILIDYLLDQFNDVSMVEKMQPYVVRFIEDRQKTETTAQTDSKPENKEVASDSQVRYKPASGKFMIGTLVPVNMQTPVNNALSALEDRVGSVDTYVARELGYAVADLEKYFAAEQIDAIALAIANISNGKGFVIGDQCVAGHTRIFNPITKQHTPIKELAEKKESIHVLAMTPDGLIPAFALPPFKKGTAKLYQVTTSDRRVITVTEHHRFLTPSGWKTLSDGLLPGHFLAFAGDPLENSSESSQLAHSKDGQRSRKTTQDSQDDYLTCSRSYGEQPHCESNSGLALSQPSADARAHTLLSWPMDDRGILSIHNHPHQHKSRHSRNNWFPLGNHDREQNEVLTPVSADLSWEQKRQDAPRFNPWSVFRSEEESSLHLETDDDEDYSFQTDCAVEYKRPLSNSKHGRDLSLLDRQLAALSSLPDISDTVPWPLQEKVGKSESFSLGDYTGWSRILKVEFVGIDDFYDMWVPGYETYVAEGLINHNTGIGKGRVNAAIMRWTIRQNRIPVFVTEKPNLYRDMIRDLRDIGMGTGTTDEEQLQSIIDQIQMTNSGESIPMDDAALEWYDKMEEAKEQKEPIPKPYGEFLKTPSSKKQRGVLSEIEQSGKLPANKRIIFTTYAQMQPVKMEPTVRNHMLNAIIENGVLLLDESHNAGGVKQQENDSFNRAGFVRNLVNRAFGVFYSSATFAKRPDVMDLYSRTDMRLAVDNINMLGATIEMGGVPLQQVVSSMLVESGQYLRRERSFEGVEYNTTEAPMDQGTAENISTSMRNILEFSKEVADAVKAISNSLKGEAQSMGATVGADMGSAESTGFSSVMHNLIAQFLLGLKAQSAVNTALEAIRNGEKPVITVANTMESLINEYADLQGINVGDPIDLTFGELLERYLEKSRMVREKLPFQAKKEPARRLTDDELGPAGIRLFNQALQQIRANDWSKIPASPIDYIKSELQKAGHKVGEITGRQGTIDYLGKTPTYRMRGENERGIPGRIRAIQQFNNGELDVLILNRAGSTGLSLHASPKVGQDVRRRHMIIAQAEANIDTHMQMLGRVHRTGQIIAPRYSQLVGNIPAEIRPAAVLAKKMASLNANTTSARDSAMTSKTALDIMNAYGDEAVAAVMFANQDLHAQLGEPLAFNNSGDSFAIEDAARKVTGRIPILPLRLQAQLYADFENEYQSILETAIALGENKLEAITLETDAKEVASTTVFDGVAGENSPFAAAARAVTYDIKRQGRSMTQEEINQEIAEFAGVEELTNAAPLRNKINDLQASVRREVQAFVDREAPNLSETELASLERRTEAMTDKITDVLQTIPPGSAVSVVTPNGSVFYGTVIGLERKGNPKNPAVNSAWKIRVALADSLRVLSLPLTRFDIGAAQEGSGRVSIEPYDPAMVQAAFENQSGMSRENRVIIEGNLLAGYSKFSRGQIAYFRMENGELRQGIVMPRSFDLTAALRERSAVMQTPEEAAAFLADESEQKYLSAQSGDVTIQFRERHRNFPYHFWISVPASRSKGGRWFLNERIRAITDDFVKSGNKYSVAIRPQDLPSVLRVIYSDVGERMKGVDGAQIAQATGGNATPQPSRTTTPAPTIILPSVSADILKLDNDSPILPEFLTGEAAIAHLAQNGSTPAVREVAAKIAPFIQNVPIAYVKAGDTVGPSELMRRLSNASGVAALDQESGAISIYLRSDKNLGRREVTVLHELIHAATMKAVLANPDIAGELDAVRKKVINALRTNNGQWPINPKSLSDVHDYFESAIRDVDELLAYTFSSVNFQELLSRIAADGRWLGEYRTPDQQSAIDRNAGFRTQPLQEVSQRSLWQVLVDAVRRLFGLQPRFLPILQAAIAGNKAIAEENLQRSKPDFVMLKGDIDRLLGKLLDAGGDIGIAGKNSVIRQQINKAIQVSDLYNDLDLGTESALNIGHTWDQISKGNNGANFKLKNFTPETDLQKISDELAGKGRVSIKKDDLGEGMIEYTLSLDEGKAEIELKLSENEMTIQMNDSRIPDEVLIAYRKKRRDAMLSGKPIPLLDASQGGGSALLNQIGYTWAMNNRLLAKADDNLSGINAYARYTGMLMSAALRRPETSGMLPTSELSRMEFLTDFKEVGDELLPNPLPGGIKPDKRAEKINPLYSFWEKGDTAEARLYNVGILAMREAEQVIKTDPLFEDITYDFDTGTLQYNGERPISVFTGVVPGRVARRDTINPGEPLDQSQLAALVFESTLQGYDNLLGIGETTLKRAIITHSLLRELARAGRDFVLGAGSYRPLYESTPLRGVQSPGYTRLATRIGLNPNQAEFKQILYSKNKAPAKTGVSVSAIEKLIDPKRAAWQRAGLTVNVVKSAADLPADLKARLLDDNAEGFYDIQSNQVYLLADNLESVKRAAEVLVHETVGHWAVMNLRESTEFLQVLNSLRRLEKVGNRDVLKIAAYVDKEQSGLDSLDRASEIFAVAVEQGLHQKIGLLRAAVDMLVNAAKKFLRMLGVDNAFVNSLTMSDILQFARETQSKLDQGTRNDGKWAFAGRSVVKSGKDVRTAITDADIARYLSSSKVPELSEVFLDDLLVSTVNHLNRLRDMRAQDKITRALEEENSGYNVILHWLNNLNTRDNVKNIAPLLKRLWPKWANAPIPDTSNDYASSIWRMVNVGDEAGKLPLVDLSTKIREATQRIQEQTNPDILYSRRSSTPRQENPSDYSPILDNTNATQNMHRGILQRMREDGYWQATKDTLKHPIKESRLLWHKLLTMQQVVEMNQDIPGVGELMREFEKIALAMDADKSDLKQTAYEVVEKMRDALASKQTRDRGRKLSMILHLGTLHNVRPDRAPFHSDPQENAKLQAVYQRVKTMMAEMTKENPKLAEAYFAIMGKYDANGKLEPGLIENMDKEYRAALEDRLARGAIGVVREMMESAKDPTRSSTSDQLRKLFESDPQAYADMQAAYQQFVTTQRPTDAQIKQWRATLTPNAQTLWDDVLRMTGKRRKNSVQSQLSKLREAAKKDKNPPKPGSLAAKMRDLRLGNQDQYNALTDALTNRLAGYELDSPYHGINKQKLNPATAALYEEVVKTVLDKAFLKGSIVEKLDKLKVAAPKPNDTLTGQLRALWNTDEAVVEKLMDLVEQRLAIVDARRDKAEVKQEKRDKQQAIRNQLTDPVQQKLFDDLVKAAQDRVKPSVDMLRVLYESNRLSAATYFPLDRFGRYQVYAEKARHGRDNYGLPTFATFETEADAQYAVKLLKADGWDVRVSFKIEDDLLHQMPPTSAIGRLFAEIDTVKDDAGTNERLKREVWEMYLRSLPDISVRKHFMKRNNIPGFSQDALQSLARLMNSKSNAIARLRHSDQLTDALTKMRRVTKRLGQDPDNMSQVVRASTGVQSLQGRYKWMLNPSNSNLANLATSLGFFWHLTNISTSLINLTQVPIWTFADLGAKFGKVAAFKELNKTIWQYGLWKFRLDGKMKENIDKEFDGNLGEAMHRAMRAGLYSRTEAVSLAGMGEDSLEFKGGAFASGKNVAQKVMWGASWFYRKSETANREISFIAAYRLARREADIDVAKGTKTPVEAHEQAYQKAFSSTLLTQGNYANMNRAPFMQGDIPRVLFLFRSYSQMMTFRMLRDAQQSLYGATPEDVKLARGRLGLMVASSALWGGAVGFPLYTMMVSLVNAMFGGDPDDPWDVEEEVRHWLRAVLGNTGQQAIMNGLVGSAAGVDIAPRVSADLWRLWVRPMPGDLVGTDVFDWGTQQFLGPVYGTARNFARSMADFQKAGDNPDALKRALEATTPAPIRNLIKAYRYETSGVTTRQGDLVVPEVDSWEKLMQAIGFTPANISEQYKDNTERYDLKTTLERRRKSIVDGYIYAVWNDDEDLLNRTLEYVGRFNEKNPEVAITSDSLSGSYKTFVRARNQEENGVYIPSKGMRARLRREDDEAEED